MRTEELHFAGTAAELRRQFDATFAARPSAECSKLQDVLAISIGGDPYALRLSAIAGLHADRQSVAMPSPVAELLGIVAIRGVLAPAYDLAALLGYPLAPGSRWLILVRAPRPVALAFASFEAHLRLPEDSFAQHEDGGDDTHSPLIRGSVRAAGVLRPLIHGPGVLTAIEALARPCTASQEKNP